MFLVKVPSWFVEIVDDLHHDIRLQCTQGWLGGPATKSK